MEVESLKKARELVISTFQNSDIKAEDKVDLMMGVLRFLEIYDQTKARDDNRLKNLERRCGEDRRKA